MHYNDCIKAPYKYEYKKRDTKKPLLLSVLSLVFLAIANSLHLQCCVFRVQSCSRSQVPLAPYLQAFLLVFIRSHSLLFTPRYF